MARLARILLALLIATTAACDVGNDEGDTRDEGADPGGARRAPTDNSNVSAPPTCGDVPDSDMSAQARAYLEATTASNVHRMELDRKLAEQGDSFRREDVVTQLSIEREFAPSLAQIPFTGQAVAPANALRQAVGDYVAVLEAMLDEPDLGGRRLDDEVERIWDRRTAAARALRWSIGLPPSTCSFRHP